MTGNMKVTCIRKLGLFATWERIFCSNAKGHFIFDRALLSNKSKFIVCADSTYLGYLPMLRVTVMMFRDIVESVMLLNEEDWR